MSVLLDYNDDFDKFLETKPKTSYPKNVMNEVKLLQAAPNGDVTIFGSIIYRIQNYAADVDLLEEYKQKGTIDNVVKNFKNAIQRIVKNIQTSRGHYFSEIKCGADDRYDIDIGKLHNGVYSINTDLVNIITKYYEQKLMDREDCLTILNNIKKLGTSQHHEVIYDIISSVIRSYNVLRWSALEIQQGFKILPANKKILLIDALKMNEMVKIDELTKLNDKFIEITNIYFLSYIDNNNKLIPINPVENPIESLKNEIEKLYFSNMYYSPFKMVKRIYALCRLQNNYSFDNILNENRDVLKKIFPFISSSMSALYQIKSEIGTIVLLLEKRKRVNVDNQLDNMRLRLASIIEIDEDVLINMQQLIIKITADDNIDNKLKKIDRLTYMIKKVLNFNTIVYLNKVYLNPLPSFLLPNYKKYDRLLVRSPNDEPPIIV